MRPAHRRPRALCGVAVMTGLLAGAGAASAQTESSVCAQIDPAAPASELRHVLKQCLATIERRLAVEQRPDHEASVDLRERELPSVASADDPVVSEQAGTVVESTPQPRTTTNPAPDGADQRPWYHNFSLSGFGAVEYLDSGRAGTRPFGGFAIRESSIFVRSTVWNDVSLFVELQVNRLAKDQDLFVRTGEMHVEWRNVLKRWGPGAVNLKAGRIDIPFGEDYLWQDAIDNPLISFAAAYPYGWDEGVVVFGRAKGLGWIAAVTDGTDERSIEDNRSKAVNVKLFGRPASGVYVSASAMHTGRTSESGIEFGGSHIEPVGAGLPSSLGASPSRDLTAVLAQADASVRTGPRGQVAVSLGRALLNDDVDGFDRALTWFSVEPRVTFRSTVYAIARYSEIGTYDDLRGYHLDGKTTAGGKVFGYDVTRLQRLSVGMGIRPNPRVLVKAEVGHDWFHLVRGSQFATDGNRRLLTAIALVVGF